LACARHKEQQLALIQTVGRAGCLSFEREPTLLKLP
jgi:hypothetical protein